MTNVTISPSTKLKANVAKWQLRFVSIPHSLLTHPGFQDLTGSGAKLLLALLAGYFGNNNGHLTATFSKMRKFGFNSKETVARALRDLIVCGYIIRTRAQRLRSPALYAITWLPINPALPSQPYEAGILAGNESLDCWRSAHPYTMAGAA